MDQIFGLGKQLHNRHAVLFKDVQAFLDQSLRVIQSVLLLRTAVQTFFQHASLTVEVETVIHVVTVAETFVPGVYVLLILGETLNHCNP